MGRWSLGFLGALLLASCAKAPESIAPAYMSDVQYRQFLEPVCLYRA